MAETLTVKSGLKDNRVAFHEVDSAHPDGGVLVAGSKAKQVGRTPSVLTALRERRLVEVSGDKRSQSQDRDENQSQDNPSERYKDMTVNGMKEALSGKGVTFPQNLSRDDAVGLMMTHNIEPSAPKG